MNMTTESLTPLEKSAIQNYVTAVWPHCADYGAKIKGKKHMPRRRLWRMAGNSHDMAFLREMLKSSITKVSIGRALGYGGNVEFVPASLASSIISIRELLQS